MKNWKDKVLGIFAGIGIMSLLMASNSQQPNVNYGTPESHVWQMHFADRSSADDRPYAINVKTGEVRKYYTSSPASKEGGAYIVSYEVEAKK